MRRLIWQLTVLFTALVPALSVTSPAEAAGGQVVVPRGDPIQIAVVLDHSGLLAPLGADARNAIKMALEKHSRIKGFRVQLNDFDGPCHLATPAATFAANKRAATAVIANPQNVAVIGHMCSPPDAVVLPIYQAAGVVTLSGSTTKPGLTSHGPDVFNTLAVADPEFNSWYATILTLPTDLRWRAQYAEEFGTSPGDYADLYYDAASLMIHEIAVVATVDHGNLVIDRAALAGAVRTVTHSPTLGFKGVTCWINLRPDGYRVNDPASLHQCTESEPTGDEHGNER